MVNFKDAADDIICGNWRWNDVDDVARLTDSRMSLSLLIDIAVSLRAIRRAVECRNVREGFLAMQSTAVILDKRLPVPKKQKRKQAKRPSKKN